MSRRTLIGVIAGLALLTGASTALAQQYNDEDSPPPPRMGWNRAIPSAPMPMAPMPIGPRPPAAVPDDPSPNGDPGGDPLLPPRAIISSLMRRGFSDVNIKRVRGDSYIAMATGPQGGRVLVVIDGHTTEITGLRQVGWDRPPRRWDDDGWPPPRPWSGPRW